MSTVLRIDPADPAPPYEQLRSQLIAQIAGGSLPPGTQLPPVRRLASDLGLSHNTVARTYREMEAAGFLRTLGRRGTIVASPSPADPGIHRQAVELTRRYVGAMTDLGVDRAALLGYVQRASGR